MLDGITRVRDIPAALLQGNNPRTPLDLTMPEVRAVLGQLLNGAEPSRTTYYVIHLVWFKDKSPDTKVDAWYSYFAGWENPSPRQSLNDPDIATHYKRARLFGATSLSFVYLHYGIPAGPVTLATIREARAGLLAPFATWAKSAKLSDDSATALVEVNAKFEEFKKLADDNFPDCPVDSSLASPTTKEHIDKLAEATKKCLEGADKDTRATARTNKILSEFLTSAGTSENVVGPRGKKLKVAPDLAGGSPQYVEEDFLPITYRIDITKKNPVWLDNLKSVVSQFGPQAGADKLALQLPLRALYGERLDMRVDYPTSDIVITGARSDAGPLTSASPAKLIGSKKYDNEKRYWFDFGFALPLKTVKQLTFNQDTGVVAPQTGKIEKSQFYGTVVLFPLGPVNTKANNIFRLAPEIIYGMALNKKPWEGHLIAAGWGLKWIQPFAGMTAIKQVLPATDSTIAGYRWSWRFTYGLQIPVKGFVDLYKKGAQ